MIPMLGHFILILQLYFVDQLSLQRALYILTVLAATYPLFRLHRNQREGYQHEHPDYPPAEDGLGPHLSEQMCQDLEQLYRLLGINEQHTEIFPAPHTILVTNRLHCIICSEVNGRQALSRHNKPHQVKQVNSDFRWVSAELFVAYCVKCRAEYFPDCITYHLNDTSYGRVQRLEYDASYLRVSKGGIWKHQRLAFAQEHAILRFRLGWPYFAEWLSDTMGFLPRITTRPSQRLYFEHFARRLIVARGLEASFTVHSNSNAQTLAEAVRNVIGRDGGIVAGAMDHGKRQFKSDASELIFFESLTTECTKRFVRVSPIPPGMSPRLAQQQRTAGTGRGYTRMAVIDGKKNAHHICAVSICNSPLVNHKNGRFCRDHLEVGTICRISPCGQIVHSEGAVTCNNQLHKDWHAKYLNRFSRMSFPGVQRVIREQHQSIGAGPTLHSELPELNGTPGNEVAHTFRARTTYCSQTVQWACGCPIAKIWASHPGSKPSFLAYDDACNLFRHIVTQDSNNPWLRSTTFIVDAWHYIGPLAADELSRIWCNPAPTNGSQPDLIAVRVDDNGRQHTTHTFDTETAEQLNSWLNGLEAQLRQMSDTNYDFCMHVLMLLYKESVEEKMVKKKAFLTEEFWDNVQSID
ncbi:hypothetical protein C8R45DRAFT_1193402 [Mycena sanguinolenta]|nr:hypothetical protein C8R45DRAFT_1193402 [Mycena sanguinolenta]